MSKSTLKLSKGSARILAVIGLIVACLLSSSLLLNLPVRVIIFLAVLVGLVLIYSKTIAKDVVITDDLGVDYTQE